ncbi:MAG: 16S rRNA (guanine(527)-N(7))-methyltransferase RsmG [Albidovulum sp.]|nr:16S rRNA (guanine(527)-N(7))-methyltransferase RsmG [Albidovulum sp.]MDE0307748.1 16S rRNA (guanine(527)-N(7))-methyltransferase RsmG [Albidovulum sp.]MDE0532078.1 16S rRNA (guanine(527)-N(7))-methyltransferase RsmG [Albidovulum sp.]
MNYVDADCEMEFGRYVSRETLARLKRFEELLKNWNSYANLVSKKSIANCRERHFKDSAQLYRLWPQNCAKWLDLGSGGGFPAIVLACHAVEYHPETVFTLVEPNSKKCRFLNMVARELELNARAETERAESIAPQNANVVSARALAPLAKLLSYAERHAAADGLCIFPKGARYSKEIDEARRIWDFELEIVPSETDSAAAILLTRNIRRA